MKAIAEEEDDGLDFASDCGAEDDQEIYEAYVAMDKKEARQRFRGVQKSRGFYKSPMQEDRQQLVDKEKSRSQCAACHKFGHWAGDPSCPRSGSSGPPRSKGKGKGKKSGKSKGRGKSPYMVSSVPTFFNLGDFDEDELNLVMETEEMSYMVHGHDSEEESQMPQDSGYTELDDRRKKPATYAKSEWEQISVPPMPSDQVPFMPEAAPSTQTQGRLVSASQEIIRPTVHAQVETMEVESLKQSRPSDLLSMKAFQLQELCQVFRHRDQSKTSVTGLRTYSVEN